MASNYTPNYGLCQWERSDDFIREEFNADNAKIDAAIKAAEEKAAADNAHTTDALEAVADSLQRTRESLAQTSYNVYNLLLQNHYDGKAAEFKKALVFDGFTDESLMAARSDGVVWMDNTVGVSAHAQGDITNPYGGTYSNTARAIGPYTVQGHCTLTGVTVRLYSNTAAAANQVIIFVTVNGVQGRNIIQSLDFPTTATTQTVPLDAVALKPGDQVSVTMSTDHSNRMFCGSSGAGSGALGGVLHFSPITAESGTVTTPALELPGRTALRGWARHSGGTVALSAAGGDGAACPFAAVGTRETVNLDGLSCAESEFLLDSPPGDGPLAFTLGLDPGEGGAMLVYDYGILVF